MLRSAVLALCLPLAAPAAGLRAGAAQVNITPPKGAPLAGYYYSRAADGVHDELHAKALVLDDGTTRLAMVACDLGGIPGEVVRKARAIIQEQSRIPADHIMISATHTHTGPVVLTSSSRHHLEGEMLRIGREYVNALPGRIAESVRQAAFAMIPARIASATGAEPTLTFNRRFHMKDGTVGWNPGKRNPNILRPAGPIDPAVNIVSVETEDGAPIAAYVNYALHLDTVGGAEYSADYPFTLSTLLGNVYGAKLTTLFTIGAAGNLNHLDVSASAKQKGHGEAARIGTILAAEVLKNWKALQTHSRATLRAKTETASLGLAPFDVQEVEWARSTSATQDTPKPAAFLDLVKAAKVLDLAARNGAPIEAEVQVFALGDELAWVALPGEIFTELGLAIKNASPFRRTIIVELANDNVGYVPDRKAYQQGNYEAVSARPAPGAGEKLVEVATRLLLSLHDGAAR